MHTCTLWTIHFEEMIGAPEYSIAIVQPRDLFHFFTVHARSRAGDRIKEEGRVVQPDNTMLRLNADSGQLNVGVGGIACPTDSCSLLEVINQQLVQRGVAVQVDKEKLVLLHLNPGGLDRDSDFF